MVITNLAAVTAWRDPEWLRGAHAWTDEQLQRLGHERTGEIEQPHVELWATVLRVPTAGGPLWFKAGSAEQAHEAGVVALLADRCPDDVPPLLATDPGRGWMLMADGGTRLRELVEAERDLSRWLDVLPRYAAIQRALEPDVDALLATGAPDRRLAVLAGQYRRLLEVVDDIAAPELAHYRSYAGWVDDACARLAGLGVPETVQHDDLHDGQVFERDGRYLVFDWGDACVSHPFFSMSVTLQGVISWGLDDVEDAVDIAPFRDAYLQPYADVAPGDELFDGFATALRLGWVCRALSYQSYREAAGAPYPEVYAGSVGVRLGMAFAGLDP